LIKRIINFTLKQFIIGDRQEYKLLIIKAFTQSQLQAHNKSALHIINDFMLLTG